MTLWLLLKKFEAQKPNHTLQHKGMTATQ